MSTPPPGPARRPALMALNDEQQAGRACVTCARPGRRGAEINWFTIRGGGRVWAHVADPCSAPVFAALGMTP